MSKRNPLGHASWADRNAVRTLRIVRDGNAHSHGDGTKYDTNGRRLPGVRTLLIRGLLSGAATPSE